MIGLHQWTKREAEFRVKESTHARRRAALRLPDVCVLAPVSAAVACAVAKSDVWRLQLFETVETHRAVSGELGI